MRTVARATVYQLNKTGKLVVVNGEGQDKILKWSLVGRSFRVLTNSNVEYFVINAVFNDIDTLPAWSMITFIDCVMPKILKVTKEELLVHDDRLLFGIVEHYDDFTSYMGYYVQNKSNSLGQAYRYKTVDIKGNDHIEDSEAFEKAKNILLNGFPF